MSQALGTGVFVDRRPAQASSLSEKGAGTSGVRHADQWQLRGQVLTAHQDAQSVNHLEVETVEAHMKTSSAMYRIAVWMYDACMQRQRCSHSAAATPAERVRGTDCCTSRWERDATRGQERTMNVAFRPPDAV